MDPCCPRFLAAASGQARISAQLQGDPRGNSVRTTAGSKEPPLCVAGCFRLELGIGYFTLTFK